MPRTTPMLIAALFVAAAWLATPADVAVGQDDAKAAPPRAAPDNAPPPHRPLTDPGPRDSQRDPQREGDGDRYRGRWDRERRPELTDEQIEQYMAVIRAHYPDFAERLDRLKEESPERFKAAVEQMSDRIAPLVREQQRDPEAFAERVEMFKLNGEIYRTARKFREAADADKPAVKAELRTLLDRQFDLRIKEAERDIAGLEKRIEQLRHELTERNGNREKLVDERVDQVLAMSDRFGDRDRDGDDRRPGFGPAPGTPGTPGDGPPRRGFGPGGPGGNNDGPPPPRPDDTRPPRDDAPPPPPADDQPQR